MSFMMKHFKNGNTGLVAICDVCHEEVTAQDANILWDPPKTDTPNQLFMPIITCKDQCTRKIDLVRGQHQYSQELEVAILCLADNTNSDMKRARRTLKLMNGIIP